MMHGMMDDCCGGMAILMWMGMFLLSILLGLLFVWLVKQIRK
ncbi:hypothetical protein [Pontibacter saemangeumensis]